MSSIEIKLPAKIGPVVLAFGADMKCRPAVARGDVVKMGEDLGDMSEASAQEKLEALIEKSDADVVLCDAHPEYFSSRMAEDFASRKGAELIRLQHHRAHVASVLMEHGATAEIVTGLAFDGTGYGDDGTIWGGEFFTGSIENGFTRRGHFASLPLPGGDAAVKNPWRIALALLVESGATDKEISSWIELCNVPVGDIALFRKSLLLPTARSTSLGRWFDAVSALLGVSTTVAYEAQAAIELQQLAEKYINLADPRKWPTEIVKEKDLVVRFTDIVRAAGRAPEEKGALAASFHVAVSKTTARIAEALGNKTVVASGGCFLNGLLDRLIQEEVAARNLRLLKPIQLPPGDVAIALGQIALVFAKLRV